MIIKKLVAAVFAGLVLFSFSSNAYAEFFSVSAGIPFSHFFSQSWSDGTSGSIESDSVSGVLLHVKLPIMLGLGLETYETKLKSPYPTTTDFKLKTTMYDVFWMTPIPIVNVTIGGGLGTTTLDCNYPGGTCSNDFEEGTASQLWVQLGFSPIPFLDVHMSYHTISATVKGKGSTEDEDFSGSLMAIGVAFIF